MGPREDDCVPGELEGADPRAGEHEELPHTEAAKLPVLMPAPSPAERGADD